ncbi:MAG TPA: hypothetical protein VLA44_09390 [Clostridia bacterium]|nr:hypothetical protein [Clostridia bacterium]
MSATTDQDVDATVPQLECEASLQRLHVPRSRLGLTSRTPAVQRGEAVPGATVARDRKRDLCSPQRVSRQPGSEAFQQCKLSGISRRITVGYRPHVQLEANGRAGAARLTDRDVLQRVTLDPTPLGVGHPGRACGRLLAKAGVEPGDQQRRSELGPDPPGLPRAVLLRAVVGWHAVRMPRAA